MTFNQQYEFRYTRPSRFAVPGVTTQGYYVTAKSPADAARAAFALYPREEAVDIQVEWESKGDASRVVRFYREDVCFEYVHGRHQIETLHDAWLVVSYSNNELRVIHNSAVTPDVCDECGSPTPEGFGVGPEHAGSCSLHPSATSPEGEHETGSYMLTRLGRYHDADPTDVQIVRGWCARFAVGLDWLGVHDSEIAAVDDLLMFYNVDQVPEPWAAQISAWRAGAPARAAENIPLVQDLRRVQAILQEEANVVALVPNVEHLEFLAIKGQQLELGEDPLPSAVAVELRRRIVAKADDEARELASVEDEAAVSWRRAFAQALYVAALGEEDATKYQSYDAKERPDRLEWMLTGRLVGSLDLGRGPDFAVVGADLAANAAMNDLAPADFFMKIFAEKRWWLVVTTDTGATEVIPSHVVNENAYWKAYKNDVDADGEGGADYLCDDTPHPRDVLAALVDYCDDGVPKTFHAEEGWCARYSAPGYLDATSWCGPFKTRAEAARECHKVFGDDQPLTQEWREEIEAFEVREKAEAEEHAARERLSAEYDAMEGSEEYVDSLGNTFDSWAANCRAQIRRSMARAFHCDAYARDVEENDLGARPGPGGDWMNVCGRTRPPAKDAAATLFERIGEDVLLREWYVNCRLDGHTKEPSLSDFGHYIAMEAMGHGVAWSDDHPDLGFDVPFVEGITYDLDPLVKVLYEMEACTESREWVVHYLDEHPGDYRGLWEAASEKPMWKSDLARFLGCEDDDSFEAMETAALARARGEEPFRLKDLSCNHVRTECLVFDPDKVEEDNLGRAYTYWAARRCQECKRVAVVRDDVETPMEHCDYQDSDDESWPCHGQLETDSLHRQSVLWPVTVDEDDVDAAAAKLINLPFVLIQFTTGPLGDDNFYLWATSSNDHWEVAQAYIALGFLPPAVLDLHLIERNIFSYPNVIPSLRRSHEVMRGWCDDKTKRLDQIGASALSLDRLIGQPYASDAEGLDLGDVEAFIRMNKLAEKTGHHVSLLANRIRQAINLRRLGGSK